jgi:hypothetical protein
VLRNELGNPRTKLGELELESSAPRLKGDCVFHPEFSCCPSIAVGNSRKCASGAREQTWSGFSISLSFSANSSSLFEGSPRRLERLAFEDGICRGIVVLPVP